MDNLISIIVPVYNPNLYQFEKCLDSIINQSYKNLQVIIIDDGSKQIIAKKIDSICLSDPRCTIIHKKNEGVAIARNTGIQISKGDLIIFVDSDDYIDYRLCEFLNDVYKGEDLILYNYARISKEYRRNCIISKEKYLYYKKDNVNSTINPYNLSIMGSLCDKAYKKSFIKNEKLKSFLKNGEDSEFNNRLFKNLTSMSYYNYIGYYYTQNQNSAVRNPNLEMINNYILTLNEFRNSVNENIHPYVRETYYSFCAIAYLMICLNLIFNNNSLSFKEKVYMHKNLYTTPHFDELINNLKYVVLPFSRKICIYFFKYHILIGIWLIMKIKKHIIGN